MVKEIKIEIDIEDEKMYSFFNKLSLEKENELEWLKEYLGKYNHSYKLGLSKYYEINNIYSNLNLLYNSKKESTKHLNLIDNIITIFNAYFNNYEGIDKLIATNYSNIEFEMYFEHDFEKSESKHYREHFIHQFRNAFLGIKLLREFKFDEKIIKCFNDKRHFYSCEAHKALNKEDKAIEQKAYYTIIYKSFILACVFHDMGYPLEYFVRKHDEIVNYLPFYKIISANTKTPFNELKAILSNSLLFKTINNNEIKSKYDNNDHGAFSALAFLMFFYSSGSIHSMTPVDNYIINLAALAMYEHTNNYGEESSNRLIFYQNPISYLLRLCDDIQEWNRLSFSIDNKHNFLICECGGLINIDEDKKGNKYICNGKCKRTFERTTILNYKKVNYLDYCEKIKIKQNLEDSISIDIMYNNMALLEIVYNDFESLQYRHEQLKKMNKMFVDQKYIPDITVTNNLTNNPVIITKNILAEAHIKIDLDKILKISIKDDIKKMSFYNNQETKKDNDDKIDMLEENLKNNKFNNTKMLYDQLKYKEDVLKFIENNYVILYRINKCN